MRIQNKKKFTKKKLIITIIVLAALGVGVISYFLLAANQGVEEPRRDRVQKNTTQSNKPSSRPSATQKTQDASSEDSTPTHEKEKEVIPTYEGENANNSQTLSGAITYSGVAGDNLIVRTNIDQLLSGGNCTITLTSGSSIVTKTSGISANPSSASCEGFDIPISELGGGIWNISIAVSSGERSGNLTGQVSL